MRNNQVDKCAQPSFVKKHDESGNTDTVATKDAKADEFWCIDWATWSYSGVPTGGRLTIAIGSTTVFDIDITAGGPGHIRFDPPLYNPSQTLNEAVTGTLYAGGSGVVGKLTIRLR